jgi:hypothetical protein
MLTGLPSLLRVPGLGLRHCMLLLPFLPHGCHGKVGTHSRGATTLLQPHFFTLDSSSSFINIHHITHNHTSENSSLRYPSQPFTGHNSYLHTAPPSSATMIPVKHLVVALFALLLKVSIITAGTYLLTPC